MNTTQLINQLTQIIGAEGVLHRPEELLVYEYDASFEVHQPVVVVLPQTTTQVSQIVRIAAEHHIPLVARGAGTGLSGGALPTHGGILVVLTRMQAITELDYPNRRAVVEAGAINLKLVQAVAEGGYTYAPDPSSGKVSTIGGNVATNAGGPHCLAYGVTGNHVRGLKAVLADGEIIETGSPLVDSFGYDLTGVLVGSEGTLALITEITVNLMPLAETVQTLMVIFRTIEDASSAVGGILGAGIIPTALEMMDGMVCRAVEAATHAGYPEDAAGVLLIEMEGLADGLSETMARIADICQEHHASDIRRATTAAERAALWAGRKGALGTMGRIAPNYYLEDGVVPRHKLPEVMAEVARVAEKYALPIGNFFHAGDGNIHPTILFDRHDAAAKARAQHAAHEILLKCIEVGGTVSGEHGIGTEKQNFMDRLYNQADLDAMNDLRHCFDPYQRLNPGKIFPTSYRPTTPEDSSTAEKGGGKPKALSAEAIATRLAELVGVEHLLTEAAAAAYRLNNQPPMFVVKPSSVDEISALMRLASENEIAVIPWGGGTRRLLGNRLERQQVIISMERLNQQVAHHPSDLVAAFQAGATLQMVNDALGAHGQMLPLDAPCPADSTLGGIMASGPLATGLRRFQYGTLRDMVIGLETVRADGRIVKAGGMVVKNVAGYDMAKLHYGAMGTLGIITQLNVKVQPLPETSQAVVAGFTSLEAAEAVIKQILGSKLQPATVALFDEQIAHLPANLTWLLVGYEHRQAAVARQVRDTQGWLKEAVQHEMWNEDTLLSHWATLTQATQLSHSEANEALLRLNLAPAEAVAITGRLQRQVAKHGFRSRYLLDAACGILWLHLTTEHSYIGDSLPLMYESLVGQYPQTVIAACPPEIKPKVQVWGKAPTTLKLMGDIRESFDPHQLLNPGRYLV